MHDFFFFFASASVSRLTRWWARILPCACMHDFFYFFASFSRLTRWWTRVLPLRCARCFLGGVVSLRTLFPSPPHARLFVAFVTSSPPLAPRRARRVRVLEEFPPSFHAAPAGGRESCRSVCGTTPPRRAASEASHPFVIISSASVDAALGSHASPLRSTWGTPTVSFSSFFPHLTGRGAVRALRCACCFGGELFLCARCFPPLPHPPNLYPRFGGDPSCCAISFAPTSWSF